MIYGLNFGAPDIPQVLRNRFPPRIKRQIDGKLELFCLVGVCTTPRETGLMTMQADNGRRKLVWVNKNCRIEGSQSKYYAVYAH